MRDMVKEFDQNNVSLLYTRGRIILHTGKNENPSDFLWFAVGDFLDYLINMDSNWKVL